MNLDFEKKHIKYVAYINRTITIAFNDNTKFLDHFNLTFENKIKLNEILDILICTYDLIATDRENQFVPSFD